jgi:hypothetical protein
MEFRGLGPNFHIHASVSDLYISTIGLPILLEEICRPILGLYKSLNVEIGAEAALFPEKEYINGMFITVWAGSRSGPPVSECWSPVYPAVLHLQFWNFEQSMGARNRVGIWLSYRPARLHRLMESIPRNRSLGFLKV